MNFDFHKTYATLSNVELLKILLQKELYQPAALAAAEKILSGRNITQEEKEAAEIDLNEKKLAVQKRQEQKEKIIVDADRTLRSIVFPEKRTSTWYIRNFVFVYAIIELISLANNFGDYMGYFKYAKGFAFFIILIDVVVPILMLYFLFRLKKIGWALLVFSFTVKIFLSTYSLITWSPPGFPFFDKPPIATYVFRLVIASMVFYFFNRKDVLQTLKISRRFQIQTITMSVLLVIMYAFLDISGVSLGYYLS